MVSIIRFAAVFFGADMIWRLLTNRSWSRWSPERLIFALLAIVSVSIAWPPDSFGAQNTSVVKLKGLEFHIPRQFIVAQTDDGEGVREPGVLLYMQLPKLDPGPAIPSVSTDNTKNLYVQMKFSKNRKADGSIIGWRKLSEFIYVGKAVPAQLSANSDVILSDHQHGVSKTIFWDAYRFFPAPDQPDNREVVYCNEATDQQPVSNCQHAFAWKGIVVKISYNKSFLPKWRSIQTQVLQKLEEFKPKTLLH